MKKSEYVSHICQMLESIEDITILKRIYIFIHRFFVNNRKGNIYE